MAIFNVRVDDPNYQPDVVPVVIISVKSAWNFEEEILTDEVNGQEWVDALFAVGEKRKNVCVEDVSDVTR